jgi:hypothetical protein
MVAALPGLLKDQAILRRRGNGHVPRVDLKAEQEPS